MIRKLLPLFISVIMVLSACSLGGDNLRPVLGKSPPIPIIHVDGSPIKVKQNSYCWKSKCADYVGPEEMLKDQEIEQVKAGATIIFEFKGKQPTEIGLTTFHEGERIHNSLEDNIFEAPADEGTYYYLLSAYWLKDIEKRISEGSSSYAFAIEVVE